MIACWFAVFRFSFFLAVLLIVLVHLILCFGLVRYFWLTWGVVLLWSLFGLIVCGYYLRFDVTLVIVGMLLV